MLTMTDAAGEHLTTLLSDSKAPEGSAVRLVVAESGLGMRADAVRDGDVTFDHGGQTVLVAAPEVAEALDGRTLDTVDTDKGTGLTLS